MAIDLKDFKKTKYPHLYKSIKKDTQKGYKYLMRCNIEEKIYKKILGYSDGVFSNLPRLDTDKKANDELVNIKKDIEAGFISSNEITLNKLFDIYSDSFDVNKRWSNDKIGIYRRYIKDTLGKKKINKIRQMDINSILSNMSKNSYSPRTQKSVLEVLKPLFNFAVINKYLKENPIINITVKIPNQKKIVINATELFNRVHKGITTYYKDNPFYQALFLFGFTGRRKSEILNLKWENIDFKNNYYWIENTKNDDKQKYPLPDFIKTQLLLINDDRTGIVFKSFITGSKISNIDRQIRNLKKFMNMESFSLHYMRNILVSMLAEQHTEAIILSGILGHKDVNTINKYLSINHFKSSQEGYKKIDEVIDIEVIEK